MKEIVLNGMPIVESLEDVNLSKVKDGSQILVLEKKKLVYTEIPYNNVKVAFLTKSLFNCLFMFEGVDTNAEIYEEEKKIKNEEGEEDYIYEIGGMEHNAKELTECYLVLDQEKQIKIKVGKIYEYGLGWEEDEEVLKKDKFDVFRKLATDDKYIRAERLMDIDTEKGVFKTDVLTVVPIGDAFLCYAMHDTICPDRYGWNRREKMYVMDKEFKQYVELDCDEEEVFAKIKELDNARYSYQFDEVRDIYFPAHHYDTIHYIKDPSGLETVCKAFRFMYPLTEDKIRQFFKPVYVDDSIEFKAYMIGVSSWNDDVRYSYSLTKGGYTFDKKEPLMGDIRKAKAVVTQLRKNGHIDIYTGVPKDSDSYDYIKEYEDAGGFMLRLNGKNSCKGNSYAKCYVRIGEMFVDGTDQEKKEMLERQAMVQKLTTEPAV